MSAACLKLEFEVDAVTCMCYVTTLLFALQKEVVKKLHMEAVSYTGELEWNEHYT